MIKKIEIRNLRNHEYFNLDISKSIVLFEGPNGSGKTSILEAIYFAATTKSHRTNTEKDMIKYTKPFGLVRLDTSDNHLEIVLTEKGKRAFSNKVEIKKISDYVGKLHVVMFAPEDLFLVKGGPSERRYFIDLELMQVHKEYLRLLNSYKRILKQRNALLKKIENNDDYTFLNILAEQLFECGSKIYDYRMNFLEELNEIIQKTTLKYDNFKINLVYEPNVLKENWLKHLKTKQKQDILYQTTMSGIHKDDFKILYNGLLAKDNASQGNIRLIVIELKLALLEWIKSKSKTKTILLLDDVLSELDIERQNMFLSMLPSTSQVFISSAIPITKDFDIQKVYIPKEIKHG